MPAAERIGRQHGQLMILLGLTFTALLGMLGVAIDLGYAYTYHRQLQNAAVSAAMAGAQTLGRHYEFARIGSGGAGLGLRDWTDAMVLQAVTSAAAASVPPFPDAATAPPWPEDPGSSLVAYYMLTNAAGNVSQGALVGSGTIPPAAAGVRVEARLRQEAIFARVLGPCCEHVDVFASARAMLRPLGQSDSGGPFIVCGGGPNADGNGAWIIASEVPSHPGQRRQILDFTTTPARVNPEYVGDTLQVHDPQLANNGAACGAGSSYKGNEDPDASCTSVGATPMPCVQLGQTGSRAGPVRNRVSALPGCAPDSPDGTTCVVLLSVADRYQSGQFRVVTYAPFLITQSSSNTHTAKLLGATMAYGQAGDGPFDPNAPGAFTVKLVPDT
jgi:hypothetical protein